MRSTVKRPPLLASASVKTMRLVNQIKQLNVRVAAIVNFVGVE